MFWDLFLYALRFCMGVCQLNGQKTSARENTDFSLHKKKALHRKYDSRRHLEAGVYIPS